MDSRDQSPEAQGFLNYANEIGRLHYYQGKRDLLGVQILQLAHEMDALDTTIYHQKDLVASLNIEAQVIAALESATTN